MIAQSPTDLLHFIHIKTEYFILTSQFNYGEVGTSVKTHGRFTTLKYLNLPLKTAEWQQAACPAHVKKILFIAKNF